MTIEVGGDAGSSTFVATYVSGTIIIPQGTSGAEAITITPESGKRIKLTGLIGDAIESALVATIKFGDREVISGVTITDAMSTISPGFYSINGHDTATTAPQIIGGAVTGYTDESVVFTFPVPTQADIMYSYEEGF